MQSRGGVREGSTGCEYRLLTYTTAWSSDQGDGGYHGWQELRRLTSRGQRRAVDRPGAAPDSEGPGATSAAARREDRDGRARAQTGRVNRRPIGITLLSGFFALGTIPSLASAVALAWPGGWADAMWRIKPDAKLQFAHLGWPAIPLMCAVAAACLASAIGLWTGKKWGQRLATLVLSVNLLGDTLNALLRHDWRTLIGLPIGGAMLVYLWSETAQRWFPRSSRMNELA